MDGGIPYPPFFRNMDYIIERITAENYHLFEDMVYWRGTGTERMPSTGINVPEELADPNLYVYAAKADGRYVGWRSLVYLPKISRVKKGYVYVDELWVQENWRRQGMATALMSKADRLKEKLNATGVRLYVNINNPGAKKLYENCGFITDGTAEFMEK